MERLSKRFPRYSKLLGFYPAGYRKEYGEQILQTVADMLDESGRSKVSIWTQVLWDFPFSVIKQQALYTGEVMATDMPVTIKRASQLGTVMVVPCFVFLLLNGALHNRLQHSWVWNSWFLFIWLILLPSVATAINGAALLRTGKLGSIIRPRSWRSAWPALAILGIGLGILALVFFHDSVHCVTGNPIRELHNPHQTWQCIQQGWL